MMRLVLQFCGSGMFIPDLDFSIPDPGFRIPHLFLSSLNYDPRCQSRIRFFPSWILDPGSGNQDPGVKKGQDPGSGSATLVGTW